MPPTRYLRRTPSQRSPDIGLVFAFIAWRDAYLALIKWTLPSAQTQGVVDKPATLRELVREPPVVGSA